MPSNSGSTTASGSGQANGVRVKAERTAGGRSRQNQPKEEMEEENGTSSQRHGRSEEGEAEEESDNDEEEAEGPSRGNKRQRVNANGDARSSAGPSEEPEDDAVPKQAPPKSKTQPRDTDGFIPGSIVRIQLKNFVTYDYVEFRPGPYLNMIVGPNGTGKSSIACAIALGLNFSPKILGRASELNAFVKNGTPAGYIEIELKGPAGKGNLIIKRGLSAKDKKSTFHLNGQPATGKEVNNKMAELNVQVENLCSFLPQDKVSSFAAMTPQQLLIETQKAAGDPSLSSWHETLKEEGKLLKVALQKHKADQDSVDQMKERNKNIELHVKRFLERQKIEQEIAVLEVLIPFARYRELRLEFMEAKEQQRKAHKKMMRLKETNAPAHELEKKLDHSVKKAGEKRTEQKKSMQAKANQLKKKQGESDQLDNEADVVVNRLESLKQEEKDRHRSIKNKETELEKTKEELDRRPPKLEDPAELQEQGKQIHMERNAIIQERDDLTRDLKEVVDQKLQAKGEVERATEALQKLDTTDSKKFSLLDRWDHDTADAVLWLRRNRDKFQMEVFEPPILSVTVTDLKYAAYAEAGFSGVQMRSFVTQCEEDLHTLNHWINDTQKALGRNVRVPTWWRQYQPETIGAPPLSPEQMNDLGFDGYINDYIKYPAGMEYFIKKDLSLHRIPITRNPNINVSKAMEYIGRAGGGVFINGPTYNTVNRSRYGRRTLGNMTRELAPAKNFIIPPVDTDQKSRLESIVVQNQAQVDDKDKRKQELQLELDKVAEKDRELKARADTLKERKDAISKEQQRIQRLKYKLGQLEESLKKLRNAPPIEATRGKLKKELMGISKKRIRIAREYTSLAESMYREQMECTKVGLELIQAQTNHAALQALCAVKDEKYTKAYAKFDELHKKYDRLKAAAVAALDMAKEQLQNLPDETQAKVQKSESERLAYDTEVKKAKAERRPSPDPEGIDLRTSEALEIELEEQKAALEITTNTNPGVIEEYEKRKRDIAVLEGTIHTLEEQIKRHNKKIKMHRDQWLPALQKLVLSIGERFSAAFDRIGCAGEIRIKEDEDYEQWAIEIYVKFRDTEKLQLLTGQRQSGGERSLTTILYLMSLTEEARAPFSLVDEINQGMDMRAERTVHNSMVEVTCKEDSAQYFLITPKLLTDLNYHKRMKVLCVNNGEWLPEEKGLGSMMNMIEGFVQRGKERRGSARSA